PAGQTVWFGLWRRAGSCHVELRWIRAALERDGRNGAPTKNFSAITVMEYADEHPYLHPAGVAGDRGAWKLASLADRVHRGSLGKNWRRSIRRSHVDRIDCRNRVSFEQHHPLHHANSSRYGAGWLSACLAGQNS